MSFSRCFISICCFTVVLVVGVSAWGKTNNYHNRGMVYGVTTSNQLIAFDKSNPQRIEFRTPILGLAPEEQVVGIDFRPANGFLYGISSTSQLYIINTRNGIATKIGGAFTPALMGTSFGVDFNPVVDRIRVVSDAEQNLRINPDNGQVVGVDGALSYAPTDRNVNQNPSVIAAAYTNPDTDPNTGTVLYNIDSNLDILTTQDPPNNGTLNTRGPLGVNTTAMVGFDIIGISSDDDGNQNRNRRGNDDGDCNCDASSYAGLASMQPSVGSYSRLYGIDLNTGRATDLGRIGYGEYVQDISIDLY